MSEISNTQSQEQKAVQRQVIKQQTIRLMQLVEMPYLSLEQEILKEVDENPALEIDRDDDLDTRDSADENPQSEYDDNGDPLELSNDLSDEDIFNDDFYRDDDLDDYPSDRQIENEIARINAPDTNSKRDSVGVYRDSQREQWQWQLGEMEMDERERVIANYLIGNLDDGGYLAVDVQSIVNDLIVKMNMTTTKDEVEHVLTQFVQELEPAGTGARNLQECLLLQLDHMAEQTSNQVLARRILQDCFDALTKKHYAAICQSLSISDAQLKEAISVITKLDPRPVDGSDSLAEVGSIITPDFIITSQNGKLSLTLNNQYVPKVRVNGEFRDNYKYLSSEQYDKKSAEADQFIKTYVEKADQFVKVLSLREKIMFNTMYEIMQRQKQFFLTGDDACLKPMILKDVAEKVKMDISTISRFSNDKYVQTDFGIIPVKHLFSEAVNDDDTSSKEIKSILQEIVDAENKKKPCSDEKLCELLQKRGYNIARRTVAKYRDQLNIPPARLRKEL